MAGVGGIGNIRTFCTAQRKHGRGDCKGAAVNGSVPPRCRMHLGTKTEVAKRVVEAEIVAQRADRFAGPVPISAADALLADIDRSNGMIVYYEKLLSQRDDHVVRSMLNAERTHSHKLTTTALAQKADEKRILLSHSTTDALADILAGIVSDLGHNVAEPWVIEIIARHLQRVVTTPDDPYGVIDAEYVAPWETDYEAWAADRVGFGTGPVAMPGDDW